MAKLLLRHIAYMCLFLMFGTFNLIIAPLFPILWMIILYNAFAILAFFIAYISYRRARKIADAIDDNLLSMHRQLGYYLSLFKIIFNGEESESKGQGEEQAEKPVETETDREDESEDYCAHPI